MTEKKGATFFTISTAIGGGGSVGRVVGQVPVAEVDRVVERRRVTVVRRRRLVVGGHGGQVAHTSALLNDGAIGELHAEQPDAAASAGGAGRGGAAASAAARGARAGVVAVVAAVGAAPSHGGVTRPESGRWWSDEREEERERESQRGLSFWFSGEWSVVVR